LRGKSQTVQNILKLVGRTADEAGYKAYAVGGFVRDLLLGTENFDIDVAIEGNCLQLAQTLAKKKKGKYTYYKKYGTATVKWPGGKIDLATARKETYAKPAALPKVKFATIKEDLQRRDFTINAMARCLNKDNFGKLIDFYGGQKDLKKKLIRVLHDKSFMDDPTRIFRAIRFEQRLGFKIEPHTFGLMKKAMDSGVIEQVHEYRLRNELALISKELKAGIN